MPDTPLVSMIDFISIRLPDEVFESVQSFVAALGSPDDSIRLVSAPSNNTEPLNLNGVTVAYISADRKCQEGWKRHLETLVAPAVLRLASVMLLTSCVDLETISLPTILDKFTEVLQCFVRIRDVQFSRVGPALDVEEICWRKSSNQALSQIAVVESDCGFNGPGADGEIDLPVIHNLETLGRLRIWLQNPSTPVLPSTRDQLQSLSEALAATLNERRERKSKQLFEEIEKIMANASSSFTRLETMLSKCAAFLGFEAASVQIPVIPDKRSDEHKYLKVVARFPESLEIPLKMPCRDQIPIVPQIQIDWPTTNPDSLKDIDIYLRATYQPGYSDRYLRSLQLYTTYIRLPFLNGDTVTGVASFYSRNPHRVPNLGYVSVIQRLASRFDSEIASVKSTCDQFLGQLERMTPTSPSPLPFPDMRSSRVLLRFRELADEALELSRGFRSTVFVQPPEDANYLERRAFSNSSNWPPKFKDNSTYRLSLDSMSALAVAHKNRKTEFTEDARECGSNYYPIEDAEQDPVCACVAIPMMLGREELAVLYVDWDIPSRANPVVVRLLEELVRRYATDIAGDDLAVSGPNRKRIVELIRKRFEADSVTLYVRDNRTQRFHRRETLSEPPKQGRAAELFGLNSLDVISFADLQKMSTTAVSEVVNVALFASHSVEGSQSQPLNQIIDNTHSESPPLPPDLHGILQLRFTTSHQAKDQIRDVAPGPAREAVVALTLNLMAHRGESDNELIRVLKVRLRRDLRPRDVAHNVFETLNESFGPCAPFIRLHDSIQEGSNPAQDMLCLFATDHADWLPIPPSRIPVSAGISGACYSNPEEPVLVEDVNPLSIARFALLNSTDFCKHVGACVAVRFACDKLSGTLHVQSPFKRAFSESDVRFLVRIADVLAESLLTSYELVINNVTSSIDELLERYMRHAFTDNGQIQQQASFAELEDPLKTFRHSLLKVISDVADDCDAWVRVLNDRAESYVHDYDILNKECKFTSADIPNHTVEAVRALTRNCTSRTLIFSENDASVRDAYEAWPERLRPYFSGRQLYYTLLNPTDFTGWLICLVLPETSYLMRSISDRLDVKLVQVKMGLDLVAQRKERESARAIEVVGGLLQLAMHGVRHSYALVYGGVEVLCSMELVEDEFRPVLNKIKSECKLHKQQLDYFRNLMVFSSGDAVVVNVKSFVDKAIAYCASRDGNNPLWIDCSDCDSSLIVRGFPFALEGIVRLVLLNAFDAVREVASARTPEITIGIEAVGGGNIWISIRDNGPGVAPDKRNDLGNVYFTTKGGPARGSGLLAAKTLVSHHRGTILNRHHSPGTEFIIVLPPGDIT